MSAARKMKHTFRGQVSAPAALLEAGRRSWVALRARYERLTNSSIKAGPSSARLCPEFAAMPAADLLRHFQTRSQPEFFAGFHLAPERIAGLQQKRFSKETAELIETARRIASERRWPLLGYGELVVGEMIDWLSDPVSKTRWPLEHYANLNLVRNDGSDIRVLWELNRLGHLITLGRAYVLTGDESFAEDLFGQIDSWENQNPVGFGPNWSCAMEVALRAMNLLAAFQLFLGARSLTDERLQTILTLLDQHGEYIRKHLEFSFIATSNHYLTDVVGLLWLGICLPELQRAANWRETGLRELLREMDKQILSDGADYESSTGYHRFVLELFLFSFILCRENSVEIAGRYWQKLRLMLEYLRACLRPDRSAPLIGDADSGQVMPIVRYAAGDHGYLLAIGAALFDEPMFKIDEQPPVELLWLLGEEGLESFDTLESAGLCGARSAGFEDAGVYVLRHDDLYLLFNASGAGLNGRGAHGHNDALSVEVSVCGTSFLSDPGTYVYTSDFAQRHLFRSTAYHSTVEVDGAEQNTTEANTPFRIGDEAQPRVLSWETGDEYDFVVAEHYGYQRLANGPITHRRAIMFDKRERYWMIEDNLTGSGTHQFKFVFHFAPELEITVGEGTFVEARDCQTGARLAIALMDANVASAAANAVVVHANAAVAHANAAVVHATEQAVLESRWFSRDYGTKVPSVAACLTVEGKAPLVFYWLLLPICPSEDQESRWRLIEQTKRMTRAISIK